jgi:hypothetical protein
LRVVLIGSLLFLAWLTRRYYEVEFLMNYSALTKWDRFILEKTDTHEKVSHFIGPANSISCSREPVTGPYTRTDV